MIDNEALHYLDNAATTRVAPEVADAIYKTMTNHWGNPSSLYTPGVESKELLDKARNIVGRTLGAEPGQVFFTGCGSESNNIALLGAALARRSWGKKIVASGFEHPSAALPLARLAEEGFEVDFVAPGADGRLDVDALADRVDKGTILVTCMQVNNETGARQDVKKLAARAAHVAELNARLRAGLATLDVVLNSPEDAVSEVLNFSTMRVKSETMLHYLEQTKVYVSSGSACSRGAASHTLGAMGLEPRRIDTALRVSFCAENTEADVDALLNGLEQGLKTLAQLR